MKKLFTLMVMALVAMSVNAKQVLTLPDGMGASVTTAFGSWEWKDVAKLYTGADVASDAKDDGVVYYDASAYDYLVIKYKECTVKTYFGVQYNSKGIVGDWGPEFYSSQTELTANTSGVVGVQLDADHKNKVYKVYLQSQGEGSLVVEEVYLGSTAEYEADLKTNQVVPYTPPTKALNLDNATNAWGDATYNTVTHTATIDKDNGASGWWVDGISGYDYLVLEILNLQKVGYAQLQQLPSGTIPLDEGSFVKVIDISEMDLTKGFSLVIQGGAGTTWTWQAAYFATAEYVKENNIKDEQIYGDTQDLSLVNLDGGWNSEYDAANSTITVTKEEGGGKGWWFTGGADYSHFDNFVVELESTTVGGRVVVEYVAEEASASRRASASSAVEFGTGATCVVVPLNADYKNAVKQIYIMGAKDATYTLKKAYVAVASATPEANIGTTDSGEEATGKSWDFTNLAAEVIAALETDAKWVSSAQGSGESAFTRYTYTEEIAKDTYVDLGDIGFAAGAGIEVGRVGGKMAGGSTIRVDANNRIQLNCSDGVFKIKNLKADDVVKIQIASANSSEARTFTITNGDKATVTTTNDGKKSEETIKVSADGDLVLQQSKAINVYTITVNGGATGIQETVAPVKVINNGAIYNLAGQKVNESYKGIVIKNGKKYIQK